MKNFDNQKFKKVKTLTKHIYKFSEFWRVFRTSKLGILGLGIVVFFSLISLSVDFISGDPFKISDKSFLPPSFNHFFGTDDLGRDVFSGVVHGVRTSLIIAGLAILSSSIIGILFGSFSGYFGGKLDDVLMRITEFFQIVPDFFLGIVLVVIFGPTIWNVIFVITVLFWPRMARVTRSEFLSLKERGFVESATSVGESSTRIIFFEILPNVIPVITSTFTLDIARAIVYEAGMSFLGLGDRNVMSLGMMLNNAKRFYYVWWLTFFPGLTLFLIALGFNLLADGLNLVFNPRFKER